MQPSGFRAMVFSSRVGNFRKLPQDGMEEPAKPNAFSLAALADAVHPIIPVPGADQRKAVTSDAKAAGEGARAMFEQGRTFRGLVRLKICFVLPLRQLVAIQ